MIKCSKKKELGKVIFIVEETRFYNTIISVSFYPKMLNAHTVTSSSDLKKKKKSLSLNSLFHYY